jgi:hypothetical protein
VSAAEIGYEFGHLSKQAEGTPETPDVIPLINSSAVARSISLFDGDVFLTFSLDKPVYSPHERAKLRGSLTNLTPKETMIDLWTPIVTVNNGSRAVWTYPPANLYELEGISILKGPDSPLQINLKPGETTVIEMFTMIWNLTGIHIESTVEPGYSQLRVVYDDQPLPEDQYLINWRGAVGIRGTTERFNETAPFEIVKTVVTTCTTSNCPATTTATVTKTSTTTTAVVITLTTTTTEKADTVEPQIYVWAIGATATTALLAMITLSRRKTQH